MAAKPTRNSALRCAVYVRVSTDKQDVENSLDRQLLACRDWAEQNGHRIDDDHIYIDEAKSGTSTVARPAFQQLIDALQQRGPLPFDALLVDDDSRLDRGGKMASIVEAFQARDVRLISVDSGRDLTDENERLLVHVKAGLNEQYVHELARRTRNGLASKVLHGYHAGGRIFGYRLVPVWPDGLANAGRTRDNREGTHVEIDDEQAEVVRRIFEWYAGGAGYRKIARRLNSEGIPSPRGGTWDPTAIRAMLLNVKYHGDWSWNRFRWRKKPETLMTDAERDRARRTGRHPRQRVARNPEDWVLCHREDLQLVSDELWYSVQTRFRGRKRVHKGACGHRRTRNPIAGIITCACGAPLATTTSKSKGHAYTRLGCTHARNRGPVACLNSTTMRLERVVEPLMGFLRNELLEPARVAKAVQMVNEKLTEQARSSSSTSRRSALRSEISRLKREIDRLVSALARGQAYDAISDALDTRSARLTAAEAELGAMVSSSPAQAVRNWTAEEVAARLDRLWEDLEKLDPDKVRLALDRVFAGISLKPMRDDWSKGWVLEMEARPWAIMLPTKVAPIVGSGGPL